MSFPASRTGLRPIPHHESHHSRNDLVERGFQLLLQRWQNLDGLSRWRICALVTEDQRAEFIRSWNRSRESVPSCVREALTKRRRGPKSFDPVSRCWDSYLPTLHLAAASLLRSARRRRRGLLSLTRFGLSEDQARRATTPAKLIEYLRGLALSEHAYEKHARAFRRRMDRFRSKKPIRILANHLLDFAP